MRVLFSVFALLLAPSLFGQVEHNFTMGPSNTTCDSLVVQDLDNEQLITAVRNTTFRYHEQMKVSRYKSPRHLWFYSCNGKTGYLIAKETDEKEIIYQHVPIGSWNELLDSADPILAYRRIRSTLK